MNEQITDTTELNKTEMHSLSVYVDKQQYIKLQRTLIGNSSFSAWVRERMEEWLALEEED